MNPPHVLLHDKVFVAIRQDLFCKTIVLGIRTKKGRPMAPLRLAMSRRSVALYADGDAHASADT